jgi:hypothetical protein
MTRSGSVDVRFPRWFESTFNKKKIGRVELHHAVEEGSNNLVRAWESDEIEGRAPSSLADTVYEAAFTDAANFRGVQRYAVRAFEDNSARIAPVGRTFLEIEGGQTEDVNEFTATGNEPANSRGHLSQMMRHNESIMKLAIVGARENASILQKLVMTQQEQLERYGDREVKVMELVQSLLDRKAERDMEVEDKQDSRQMKKMLIGKGLEMAPVLMTKLLSRGTKNPEDEQIKGLLTHFASTLNEEQMMNLMGVLDDGQKAVFIELYTTLQKQAEEQRKAQEAMAIHQEPQPQGATSDTTETKQTEETNP